MLQNLQTTFSLCYKGVCPKKCLEGHGHCVIGGGESFGVVSIAVSQLLACISHMELMMALSMSDNELYASEKWEDFVFLLEEGVCWSLMMHRSSSRKRCFVLEGEGEVFSTQAAAFRRNVQGHRELNAAELVESCYRGLEERLARKKAS